MDARETRVAVVAITYNRCDEVLRTLDRLVRLPERPRVVLVDNGSTDGTAVAVAERFPEVDLLAAGVNLGAAGRTLGARHVDTPFIAFCDDDTWWAPGSIRRAADLFEAHPRLAVLTARILVGPEEVEDPTCEALRHSPLPPEPDLPGPPLQGFLAGASMVRRSVFLDVGGFDSRIVLGGEEEWVAADLAARGWGLCYVPDVIVHHHPSPRRDAPGRRWLGVRNALWFTWLRRPWPSAVRRTAELAAASLRDATTLRGFAAGLAGLSWVLRERRVLPPEVEERIRCLERAARRADRPLAPASDSHVLRPGHQGRSAPAGDALLDL